MADINTEVLIIGGGVAGSAAACAFSKKGYEVLLLEKSENLKIQLEAIISASGL